MVLLVPHDSDRGPTGRYGAGMRRFLTIALRLALAAGALAVVRQVLLDRSPRQALQGSDPVIGSLDTWPDGPRRRPLPPDQTDGSAGWPPIA